MASPAERSSDASPQSWKVALIHVADEGGGAERSVLTLHQSLLERGHQSRLFVGSKHTQTPGVIEIPRQRQIPGALRAAYWMENRFGWQNLYAPWFRNLPALIGDADIIHVHTLWGGRYAYSDLNGLVRLARRYPLIMTLRDGWMLTGHCACPINCDRWKTGCGQCPDLKRAPAIQVDGTARNWKRKQNAVQSSRLHVTAVSTWLKSQVEQSPIFRGKPVQVVHNSVDESVFCPADRDRVRHDLGIPNDRLVVLLAGQTIEGVKDGIAQQAVEALNQINHPRLMALLVGRSAEKVGELLRIPYKTLPFQKEPEAMARCYQAADLTLVTSAYETFGRIAAESLCCGVPVLTFATGGLTDIVKPGIGGYVVPTGDVSALAQKLRAIVDQPEYLSPLADRCATWARNEFSRDKITEAYMNLYRSVRDEAATVG